MNTDLIVSWPNNCDYPLWRQFIHDNRHRFQQVFVVFTETYQQPDYREFITKAMFDDAVTFITAPMPKHTDEDWRDLAVNEALQQSRAEWVWFTEQDFLINEGFFEAVESLSEHADVIAAYDGDRMHPCCIFARRGVINITSRNFGIVRDKSDHFSVFQMELETSFPRIFRLHPSLYFHYNGLSSNFTLLTNGQIPNWQPEVFAKYLEECLKVSVPLDQRFVQLVTQNVRE